MKKASKNLSLIQLAKQKAKEEAKRKALEKRQRAEERELKLFQARLEKEETSELDQLTRNVRIKNLEKALSCPELQEMKEKWDNPLVLTTQEEEIAYLKDNSTLNVKELHALRIQQADTNRRIRDAKSKFEGSVWDAFDSKKISCPAELQEVFWRRISSGLDTKFEQHLDYDDETDVFDFNAYVCEELNYVIANSALNKYHKKNKKAKVQSKWFSDEENYDGIDLDFSKMPVQRVFEDKDCSFLKEELLKIKRHIDFVLSKI